MAQNKTGTRPPNEKGRETLSVRDPFIERVLGSFTNDVGDIPGTRVWGNRLQADARLWLARGGFAERDRIDKRDAGRMLALALTKMEAAK